MKDNIDDMAMPLAKDHQSEITLESEQIVIIPIEKPLEETLTPENDEIKAEAPTVYKEEKKEEVILAPVVEKREKKVHTCKVCLKSFKKYNQLVYHRKKEHTVKPLEVPVNA